MLCSVPPQKAEVFEKFKEFEAAVTNATGSSIGALRSDNGGEYLSTEFLNYLKSKGIQHELTVPNTPEQNGVSERTNRTLMESARSMLSHAGLQNNFWAEAVATAAYVRNRSPTSAQSEDVTPYQKWYGCKPNLEHLKVLMLKDRSWTRKQRSFISLVIVYSLKVTDYLMKIQRES